MPCPKRARGFTLIELMVGVIILAVLLAFAIPSFIDARQRAAVRGAADQVASFWADARFEALRRNQPLKVTMRSNDAGAICLGTSVPTSAADNTPCDCYTAGACDVATYPQDQNEWRGSRMPSNPTVGTPDDDLISVVLIDPKRGVLLDPTFAGVFSLQSPDGGTTDYRLNVAVDRNGRAFVCEPAAAPDKLPQYVNRRC